MYLRISACIGPYVRSLAIFLGVRVWIQYCQVAMDGIQTANGIDNVRKLYERAVTAVGLHVTEVRIMFLCISKSFSVVSTSQAKAGLLFLTYLIERIAKLKG